MTRSELFFVIFISCVTIFISYAVFTTARDVYLSKIIDQEEITERKSRHLPTECAEYYNDGTDRWIDCMGVGYK